MRCLISDLQKGGGGVVVAVPCMATGNNCHRGLC